MRSLFAYIRILFFFVRALPDRNKARKLKRNGDEGYKVLLNKWYEKAMKVFPKYTRSTIIVNGKENIRHDGPVIYVSNHQSYPDPIAVFYALGFPCAVMAKKEVANLPLVCGWLEVLGCVYVDRDDARKSLTALREASESIDAGNPMLIFPEGTRTHDGSLGEFKAGAFKVAEKTHAPIIPVRLSNMHNVMRRGKFKIGMGLTVTVDILPEIDISNMTKSEIRALPEKIKELIADGREELV